MILMYGTLDFCRKSYHTLDIESLRTGDGNRMRKRNYTDRILYVKNKNGESTYAR